jgi:uncharacterized protein YhbP (UPF0306 family)
MDANRRKRELIANLLAAQTTLSLATVTPDGSPRVTPLFYLPQDLRLYWFSSPSSGHSRNLAAQPDCAVTVYSPATGWKEIRGAQMRGAVSRVKDPELHSTITPQYITRFQLSRLFQPLIAKSALYCFEPHWLRYLDNSRRFGYKFELTLTTQNTEC